MNKAVYIQSIDLPNRYLSKDRSGPRISLLPFSSNAIAFVPRPCIWQLLQQTYSHLTCISLECANEESRKNLRHGNHRLYLELPGNQNQGQSPNFVGDASFLLVGNATHFRLQSTVGMQIDTAIWLQYDLPSYEVRMVWENGITNFHHFRFVLQ